jgi:hypothetical protein
VFLLDCPSLLKKRLGWATGSNLFFSLTDLSPWAAILFYMLAIFIKCSCNSKLDLCLNSCSFLDNLKVLGIRLSIHAPWSGSLYFISFNRFLSTFTSANSGLRHKSPVMLNIRRLKMLFLDGVYIFKWCLS